jgi:aspartokinase
VSVQPESAGELVRDAIERDGVVRNGLARGLINHRALARWIQENAGFDVSFDAVLNAIRRYPLGRSTARRQAVGRLMLKLSLKNKVAVLSLRNEREVQRAIAKFSEQVNYANGETFRVVSSMDAVSVTLDSKNAEKLESQVLKSVILRRLKNLAELTVAMDAEIERSSGVISTIASELATNDVNIRQLASVGPGRVLILIDEKDAMDAYRALEDLSKAGNA